MTKMSDAMTKVVIRSINANTSIEEAEVEVREGCFAIVEREKLLDITTERDIVQSVVAQCICAL